MKRIWRETISPKWMHDTLGIFHGYWMPQMDRCWISDDGYQVVLCQDLVQNKMRGSAS